MTEPTTSRTPVPIACWVFVLTINDESLSSLSEKPEINPGKTNLMSVYLSLCLTSGQRQKQWQYEKAKNQVQVQQARTGHWQKEKKRQKDNDKDVDKEDDKAEDELSEFDLVSHHLTRPSALAVISSLQVLLAVHTDTRER